MAIIKFIIDDTANPPVVKAADTGDISPDILQLQPGDRLYFSTKSHGKRVFVDLDTGLVALVKYKSLPSFSVIPLDNGDMHISLKPPTGAGTPELDPP